MKWRHTFQTRIAGVLALLLLVVVAATYFSVKTAPPALWKTRRKSN